MGGVAVNLALLAWRFAHDWYTTRAKLSIADEDAFQHALTSESLATLGSYLDKSLGQFLLSEYADNPRIRRRVDLFVTRLQEYVGPEEPLPWPPKQEAPKPTVGARAFVDRELKLVEDKLISGPTWDALASLRRLIEVRLRLLADKSKISLSRRVGAGGILQALLLAQAIPGSTAERLRYAINVANRGIHGIDVSSEEGYEALRQARSALEELRLLQGRPVEED
jgi:hypothetical protein